MSEKQYKVLFVDDEKFALKSLQRELSEEPYELLVADSGKKALDLLVRHNVAVIVSDLMMPVVGGQELLTIVKNDYPNTIRVIQSGTRDRPVIQKILKDDLATAYFFKPLKYDEEVKPKIRQFLGFYQMKTTASSLRNALQQVMEISKDGFILFDSAGEIHYINSAAKVLCGHDTDKLKEQVSLMIGDDGLRQLEVVGSSDSQIVIEDLADGIEWHNGPVRLAIMIKK
jgi:response regulator RpfG family c-di-GMP phosphodiesterase